MQDAQKNHPVSKLSVYLFGLAAASLSMILIILSHKDSAALTWYYTHITYYVLWAIFAFWIYSLAGWVKTTLIPWKKIYQEHKTALLVSLLLTAVITLTVPSYFRILSDETNLISVSKSMSENRTVENPTMGKWYYYNFYSTNREVEKRPPGFPFLLHLVHLITGYRAENAFALNRLILLLFFLALYGVSYKSLGKKGAIAVLIAMAAHPALAGASACGGFDLAACFFGLLILWMLQVYLHDRRNVTFYALYSTLIFSSYIRHESPVFFAVVLGTLLISGQIQKRFLFNAWTGPLTFLFMVPGIWHHLLRHKNHDLYETPGNIPAFSMGHFAENSEKFFKGLFRFDYFLPYALPILILGFLGLLLFIITYLLKSREKTTESKVLFFITLSSSLVLWIILVSFHMGDLTHPVSARYSLLFLTGLSYLTVWLLLQIRMQAGSILIASLLAFAIYFPSAIENRFSNTLFLPREYRWDLDFLKGLGHRNFLLITERPGQFTVHNFGAMNFAQANKDAEPLLTELERHLFREIYVIQEIEYETNLPVKDHMLDASYRLKTIQELQNKAESFIRISRVARHGEI